MPSDDDEDVSVKDETASGVPSSAEANPDYIKRIRFSLTQHDVHPRGGGEESPEGRRGEDAADSSPAEATPNTGFLFARDLSPNAMRDVGDASDHNGTDPEQRDEIAATPSAPPYPATPTQV